MLAILVLTVSLTFPGQESSEPVTFRFPQPSFEACRSTGAAFLEASNEKRRFSFSCEIPS